MTLISAVYPNTAGSRFDTDYYLGTHSSLAARLLAPYGLLQLRVVLGLKDLSGAPPAFWAISELHFTSTEAFEQALRACGEALFADSKNYTNVTPLLQFGEVHVI